MKVSHVAIAATVLGCFFVIQLYQVRRTNLYMLHTQEESASQLKEMASRLDDMKLQIEKEIASGLADIRQCSDATNAYQKLMEIMAASGSRDGDNKHALANALAAEDAYARAVDNLKNGDKGMAKIYCLNAINHLPSQLKYFQKLFEIYDVDDAEQLAETDLEQLQGILETGIYQVAGRDVAAIHEMLAKVISRKAREEERSSDATSEMRQATFAKSQEDLKTGELAWDKISNSPDASTAEILNRRMAILNVLADTSTDESETNRQWIQSELKRTELAIAFLMQSASLKSYLDRAEDLLDAGTNKMEIVSALTQTASQLLSQSLGADEKLLPDGATKSLHDFARRIANIETRFNMIKSRDALEKINAIINEMHYQDDTSSYELRIRQISDGIKKISRQLSFVYDLKEKAKIENQLVSLSQRLTELREQQYAAYQRWAINECESAFAKYRSWTRVDEEDALEVINLYLLKINSTLLTPDVNRLYQDVLGKQFAELSAKPLANIEIKMAREQKKTLKDF
jgi:hypothetical protein